jgi:hypothetical protein
MKSALILGLVCGGLTASCNGGSSEPPPMIAVTLSASSASIQTSTTKQFTANLQNDLQNQGATWSVTGPGCTGATCGTLLPTSTLSGTATTYTAPPNVPNPPTITLAATAVADRGKSASTLITIIPAPSGVSVSPPIATVQSASTQAFGATISPAAASQAITWSLSGAGCAGTACGTLSGATDNPVTYTAPPTGPNPATVTITAVALGDPTKQAAATITIPPIIVDARPGTASVPVNGTQEFIAGVTNDPLDTGVTWTLTGAGCTGANCGTLSTTTTARLGYTFYTAPATIPSPNTVTVSATSVTAPSSSGSATVTITSANNALLNGRYGFVFEGFDSGGQMAIAGSFNADGAGNITGGVEDINRAASTTDATPLSFNGTYVLGPNNKGQMTLTNSQGTATFHFVIDATGSKASFTEFDDITGTGTRGSGSMQKQVPSAFSLAQTNGSFIMGLFGDLPGAGRAGLVGRFSSNSTGVVSGAVMDFSIPGASFPNLSWTGSVAAPDSATGRGTMTLNATIPSPGPGTIALTFAYYIIATNKLFVVGTNARGNALPLLSGHVRGQNIPGGGFTDASLIGNAVFALEGTVGETGSVAVGQATFDGSGNLTGVFDQNDAGTFILNTPFAGTYTVSANGRASITFQFSPTNSKPHVLYLESSDRGFILEAPGSEVTFGEIKPQAAGSFSTASLLGTFGVGTWPPPYVSYQDSIGLSTLDGAGSFNVTIDTSDTEQFLRTKIRSGTYAASANGRGTVVLTGGELLVFWMVSPSEFLCIFTLRQVPLDTQPALLDFVQL